MLAGVRYVFFWSGGTVTNVLARVILTDVTYSTDTKPPSYFLKQQFRTEWQYNAPAFAGIVTMQTYDNQINNVNYYSQFISGTQGNFLYLFDSN